MKLWMNVSMISVLTLLAVVAVCSVLLLMNARNSILSLTTEQARAQQRSQMTSFSEMARYYLKDESNPVVKESGVKYCFSRFADDSSVVMRGDQTLYSSVTIDPVEFLPLSRQNEKGELSGQQVFLGEIDGRNILIVGSADIVTGDEYSVYVVKDITGVYNNIISLIRRFIAICAASVIIGTLLIIFLMRRASKPLVALKDVAHRIANGEYSKRANINTKDEVGELAVDFNVMADAVQSRIEQLTDTAQCRQLFISGLTHEIKTPMASMMIHTDTLLTADLSAGDAKASLAHIHEQCRWLERLSQKLLKLITLEEGIHVQPENMRLLLEDAGKSAAEALRAGNTPLIIECDVESLAMDYDLMKSLLINLIDNASKASGAGQEIRLRAYGNTIEVADSGRGIPKDEIARVTDAFYMADRSRSRKAGGSGLGLALVKHIADAHGAQLIIESELDAGTIVKIIFPESGNC